MKKVPSGHVGEMYTNRFACTQNLFNLKVDWLMRISSKNEKVKNFPGERIGKTYTNKLAVILKQQLNKKR